MRGSRNFCKGGPGPTARKKLKSSDDVFFKSSTFFTTVVYQWFISKKTIVFQGVKGGQYFPGGGGSNLS